jgi:dienelactone hydrolase
VAVRRFLLLVACLGVAITACGGDDDASQERTGPYNVGTRSLELVDKDRPTPAFGGQPELNSRTVVTDVWYPATGKASDKTTPDAPPAEGPFPLVVFNHGQQGAPEQYAIALRLWAQAGYVVAAPRHPLTIKGGPGAQFVQDMQGEIGDIPLVITQVGEQLPDLVDLDHVGVAGHSSGAIASLAVGANTCCRDDRIDAVVLEAGLDVPLDGEYFTADDDPALLFIYGDTDVNAMKSGRGQFDKATSPKLFMTVQGGDHSKMFREGERANLVSQTTLDFLDRYLKDRKGALDDLQSTVDKSGLATLEAST